MSAPFAPARRARVLRAALTACVLTLTSVGVFGIDAATTATPASAAVGFGQGYWLVAGDGGVFTHGSATFYGSEGGIHINSPVVGGAAFPFFEGYWLAAADGGVFTHGSARFFGSEGSLRLNSPVVGMASTPTGAGYWLAAADGGVFTHGDAGFFGSEGSRKLNAPVVGMAATPSGKGYWLVASDGGIFTHGDAGFFGSEGGIKLNKPVVGMAATPSGKGYWLVASDGGIFTHGDAGFFGSEGSLKLNQPVVGMAATNSGNGYRLTAKDGGVFTHGDAQFKGSEGSRPLTKPVVGILTRPPFAMKVDPFPQAGGDVSTWGSNPPAAQQLTLTDGNQQAPTNVPAGARVLGVEGLTVQGLGQISFTFVSGTACDDIRPRFSVVVDTNGDNVGDTTGSFACGTGTSPGATVSFTPTSALPALATVTDMEVLEDGGGSVVLDDITVHGLVVGDFDTHRQID